MAVEAKRGCGYRKVHGTYLVAGNLERSCDRLPHALTVCPCCGAGVKAARGFTWIEPAKLFGEHEGCRDTMPCPMCHPSQFFRPVGDDGTVIQNRAGLIWVGDKFYSPREFLLEASVLGVSRRVTCLPRGFKIGETFVFLAHTKACHVWVSDAVTSDGQIGEVVEEPGIFCVFKPTRVEFIVKQSEMDLYYKVEAILANKDGMDDRELIDILPTEDYEVYSSLQRKVERGMTLVPVPDDDKDHQ